MARYSNDIKDQYGRPIPGVSVYVYTFQGALAVLEEDGGGALDNPVTSDEYGGFYFNAADGLYLLSFSYGGEVILKENYVQVGTGPVLPVEILAALANEDGATLIGTATTGTVQESLDGIQNSIESLQTSIDEFEGQDGSGNIGFTHSGTSAKAQTVSARLDQTIFASDFTGYDPTGLTDSYAAIVAADVAARAQQKTLIFTGTPRVDTPIVLAGPTQWEMQGSHFKPGDLTGSAYFTKPASMNATFLTIPPAAKNSVLTGINIRGVAGNGGDGIQVTGDKVVLDRCGVDFMGGDGVRIGSKVAGAFNADCFQILNLSTGYNVGRGLVLDDASGGPDANSGTIAGLWSLLNGSHGVYVNRAKFGNTFTGATIEGNTGYGIYLDTNATQNVFMGGDVEGNTAGNINEVVKLANSFFAVTVQGTRYSNFAQTGLFLPVAIGSSTPGTGTYSTQKGVWSLNGGLLTYVVELAWSAHTGTGNLQISLANLPFTPNSVDPGIPAETAGTGYSQGITLGADAQLVFGYNHNTNLVNIYSTALGVPTALPMDTSVTALRVTGVMFPLIPA